MFKKIFISAFLVGSFMSAVAQQSLNQFKFMLGDWSLERQGGKIFETWKRSSSTEYSGKSYSIKSAGDSVLLENMILKVSGREILFVPTAVGQNDDLPVIFKLVSSAKNSFVFENQQHDFPSKIVYQNTSPNKLLAWIEGTIDGKPKKIEYLYIREN
jgi:hypothetical protein